MMIDLLVSGGRVVFPGQGVSEVAIGVEGTTICGFYDESTAPEAREKIDVRGAHVFPGGLDPHVHFGITNAWDEDYELDSQAAIAGGYTSVVSYYRHAASYLGSMPALIESAEAVSSVDFGLSLGVLSETHWRELAETVRELGVVSWKFYRQYEGRVGKIFGLDDPLALDDGDLLRVLVGCADISPKVRVCIHCEDMALAREATQRVRADPAIRNTLEEFAATSPGYPEAASVMSAMYVASIAQTSNLYVVHLSSGRSVDVLDRVAWLQKETGTLVESTAHYLMLTKHAPAGLWAMVSPPIQDEWDRNRLWDGIASGVIQAVGSDHCSTRPLAARGQETIWEMDTGFGGVGLMFPLMITEGHHKRGLPLERIAWLTSAGPARAFGLYPKKGAMEVGSDADFAVIDLEGERAVTVDMPNVSEEYSVYDGMRLKGWPTRTVLRGTLVWDQAKGHLGTAHGSYLWRAA